jgi:hypothetical protein
VYPATTLRHFENRIKAAPTTFSFSKVPTNILVYPWPQNYDWRQSERLLGTAAALIDPYKWDCLNAQLGPWKRVNLIMVGFGNRPPEYGHWQQAAWIGGKKNDLVICFGGGTKTAPATWAYAFGWTERELVKKNLQTLLMEKPINDGLLQDIESEVAKDYVIKDWHKFDYISLQPPAWSYCLFLGVLAVTQVGLYWFFHANGYRFVPPPFRRWQSARW